MCPCRNASSENSDLPAHFGLQRKALRAWSLKAEYQYFDFGGEKATGSAAGSESGIKVFNFKDLTANTVKAGIDYHLSPPYEPLKISWFPSRSGKRRLLAPLCPARGLPLVCILRRTGSALPQRIQSLPERQPPLCLAPSIAIQRATMTSASLGSRPSWSASS